MLVRLSIRYKVGRTVETSTGSIMTVHNMDVCCSVLLLKLRGGRNPFEGLEDISVGYKK